MKKRWVILLLLFLLLIPFGFNTILCYAEDDAREKLNESILDEIEHLDLDELDEYVHAIDSFDERSVSERILDYIQSENVDYSSFFETVQTVLFEKIKDLLPAFSALLAIALIGGILETVKNNLWIKSTEHAIKLVSFLTALVPILTILTELIKTAQNTTLEMQTQINLVFPVLLTLMTASGQTISASIVSPSVAFLSTIIIKIMTEVVYPIAILCIAFSIANGFSGELKIGKFSDFFKSCNKWIIGTSVSVFGVLLSMQGLQAGHSDSIFRQVTKYAISNGVPMVGGLISGGLDLTTAGCLIIKNSFGVFALILMLISVIEPLSLFIATSLFLRITASITGILFPGTLDVFLSETAEQVKFFLAGFLFVAFLYFITLLLCMLTGSAYL